MIYSLVDDVRKASVGLLEPTYVEVIDGRGEILDIFTAGKKGKVAGIRVTEGKVSRGTSVRVRRQEEVVSESVVSSLRRFKDDVKEVNAGYECGVGIKDYDEFQKGDILEFHSKEKAG